MTSCWSRLIGWNGLLCCPKWWFLLWCKSSASKSPPSAIPHCCRSAFLSRSIERIENHSLTHMISKKLKLQAQFYYLVNQFWKRPTMYSWEYRCCSKWIRCSRQTSRFFGHFFTMSTTECFPYLFEHMKKYSNKIHEHSIIRKWLKFYLFLKIFFNLERIEKYSFVHFYSSFCQISLFFLALWRSC